MTRWRTCVQKCRGSKDPCDIQHKKIQKALHLPSNADKIHGVADRILMKDGTKRVYKHNFEFSKLGVTIKKNLYLYKSYRIRKMQAFWWNYPDGRKQHSKYDGFCSEDEYNELGVPQGTVIYASSIHTIYWPTCLQMKRYYQSLKDVTAN
jgi:hypothetical protein